MSRYKRKQCSICSVVYQPTGAYSKFCPTCAIQQSQLRKTEGQAAWRRRQGMEVGRGGKLGSKNQAFKHGQCTFRRWAKEKKEANGVCELCNKSLVNATHYEWVGHHRDHNRMNNTQENLMLLCKKCHQIEHKCWKAFEGVTTSRKT